MIVGQRWRILRQTLLQRPTPTQKVMFGLQQQKKSIGAPEVMLKLVVAVPKEGLGRASLESCLERWSLEALSMV